MMDNHQGQAGGRQDFEQHVSALIARSGKSQREIERVLGYSNANIITMFKNGSTRVPPEKVVPLAQALGHSPSQLLRDWFHAYMPNVLIDIDTYLRSA